jgi:ribosomal protein S18 acetylase RimI-like enzyme
MDLIPAGPDHMEEVKRLFREYEEFLGCDLCFQGFGEELASLPGEYSHPDGVLVVAVDGDSVAGCVALRKQEEGICEMKRLYVRPGYRGTGLGRRLAVDVIERAMELGYSVMRLDTLDRLEAAMRLYESLGFRRTEPYYPNPLEGVVYWELELH